MPADVILLEGSHVSTDESNITGEPNHQRKTPIDANSAPDELADPFLIGKSTIMSGKGLGLVCAVGSASQQGQAEEKLSMEDEQTPLQAKLDTIAAQIGTIGLYCAILTFVGSLGNLLLPNYWKGESSLTMATVNSTVNFLIVGITIIVVAVPEGLPLAVTISLAFSVMKMKKEQNLVRRLDASETMGGASQICSDKTGTLTQNLMTVVSCYAEGKHVSSLSQIGSKTREHLIDCICVNSSANIIWDEKESKEIRTGNQTECGLLQFVRDDGIIYENKRSNNPETGSIPFSSKRKRMTTVVEHSDELAAPREKRQSRIFTKGASEILLERCTHILNEEGEVEVLSLEQKAKIRKDVITHYATQAYRTLALAYRDYGTAELQLKDFELDEDCEFLENNLTLIAIVGIQDPLRPDVRASIEQCRKSGIVVRMVTGDNLETARAISREAGILLPEDEPKQFACMEGEAFREYVGGIVEDVDAKTRKKFERPGDEAHFREVGSQLRVLARSSPQDKYLLVTGLKNLGEVVAVTGDGTNDAPALKKADVGFAMGKVGTDVAKEASDIILLDDNFSSIITAIKWGRNIYASIRKFLQFQLTVNIVAMFMAFIGGVVTGESPLNSVQMLWVNLIMDTFAALALATEPPSEELLDDAPHSRKDSIVTANMWRNIIGLSVYQILVLSLMLFGADSLGFVTKDILEPWTPANGVHFTMIFNTFVFMQVFNEVNARKIKPGEFNVFAGFFNNWMFLFIEALTIGVQIALVQLGGEAVKCSPLSLEQHAVCLAIGLFSIPVGFFVKLLPKRLFAFTVRDDPMDAAASKHSVQSLLRKGTMSRSKLSRDSRFEKTLSFAESSRLQALKRSKTFN